MTKQVSNVELTASPVEPVSLDLLRAHCHIVADDDDDLILSYAKTARMMVEKEAHVSLVRKTLRHRLPCWPLSGIVALMRAPLVSIESVKYFDADNAEQTLAAELYRLDIDASPPAFVIDSDRPSLYSRRDAVTIAYTAGHDPDDNPAPEPAVAAIMLLVAHWYRNREATVVGVASKEIELGYERLVALLKEETYP